MRIAVLALSARGAMGQYLSAWIPPLSCLAEVQLFVPEHWVGEVGNAQVHLFRTGSTRRETFFRLLNPLRALQLWREIYLVCPDLVHIFNGEGYPWTLLISQLALRNRVPLVVTVHDPQAHPGNLWEALNAHLRLPVLRGAAVVHIHSKQFVDVLVHQGVSRDRIWVIPHGSIAERFTRYMRSGVPRERMALFFGRIESYKGLDVLAQAALLLDNFKVVIAGPGKMPQELKAFFGRHPEIFEVHNRYLRDEEVAELFQRSAVCVLPYKQATQSSIPLIAAAFGVPVVASAVGAFLEDVPKVNGLLVPPNDPTELARGIERATYLCPIEPPNLRFDNLAYEFLRLYRAVVQHGSF